MATFTWGSSTADWFASPSPWQGGFTPSAGDDVLIGGFATYQITLAAGESAAAANVIFPPFWTTGPIIFPESYSQATLDIAAGTTLAAAVAFADGTLVLGGTLAGTVSVPGPPATPPFPGLIQAPSIATLVSTGGTIAGSISLAATGYLRVSGALQFSGLGAGISLTQGAVLDLAAATTIDGGTISGQGSLSAGSLTIGPTATIASTGTLATTSLANEGAIAVPAGGTLVLRGTLDNTGSIAIAAGATLDLSTSTIDMAARLPFGTLAGPGTLVVATSVTTIGRTIDLAGPEIAAGLAGLQVTGYLHGATLLATQPGIAFSGDAATTVLDGVTVVGTLNLVTGIGDAAGALPSIRHGITLRGASGGQGFMPLLLPDTTLQAYGTIAGAAITLGSGINIINISNTLDFAADSSLTCTTPAARDTITGGTNHGVIDFSAQGGTLSLPGLINRGSIHIANSSTVNAIGNSGGFSFASDLVNYGTITVADQSSLIASLTDTGGSVTLESGGTVSVSGFNSKTHYTFADASDALLSMPAYYGFPLASGPITGFSGNNAIALTGLAPAPSLSFQGDATSSQLTVSTQGTQAPAVLNLVGDYTHARFGIEQRGRQAYITLATPAVPVLLSDAAAFYAAQGDDTVIAGPGDDTVAAGFRHVMAWGGAGSSTITTAPNDNTQHVYAGGSGNQVIFASGSSALIFGGSGIQQVIGGSAAITVAGGSGPEVLQAGSGPILFQTGAAPDLIGIPAGAGASVLMLGFRPEQDRLYLEGYGPAEPARAIATQIVQPGGVSLLLADGAVITLAGLPSLPASSFL